MLRPKLVRTIALLAVFTAFFWLFPGGAFAGAGAIRERPQVLAAGFDPSLIDRGDDSFDVIAILRPGAENIVAVSLEGSTGAFSLELALSELLPSGDQLWRATVNFAPGSIAPGVFSSIWGQGQGQFQLRGIGASGQRHAFPDLEFGQFPAASRPLAPGRAMAAVFADGLSQPEGITVSPSGEFYVSNTGDGTIAVIGLDQIVRRLPVRFSFPVGLIFNQRGNLLVADAGDHSVLEVNPSSGETVAVLAEGIGFPNAFAIGPDGSLYFSDSTDGSGVFRLGAEGRARPIASGFRFANGIAFDSRGRLFVADFLEDSIVEIELADGGVARRVGILASGPPLNRPDGLAFDANEELVVANNGGDNVLSIDRDGRTRVLASGAIFASPASVAIGIEGDIFLTNIGGTTVVRVTPAR